MPLISLDPLCFVLAHLSACFAASLTCVVCTAVIIPTYPCFPALLLLLLMLMILLLLLLQPKFLSKAEREKVALERLAAQRKGMLFTAAGPAAAAPSSNGGNNNNGNSSAALPPPPLPARDRDDRCVRSSPLPAAVASNCCAHSHAAASV
jgi:hypothetical protein